MKPDRAISIVAVAFAVATAIAPAALAGGVGFSDEDSNTAEGPSFFGFVRDVDGPGVAGAKVTAELKNKGALVTRTDIMGVYKIPGFGKDINPDDVTISCAKDGYKQASVLRRPHAAGDTTNPVEIECYLQKQ